MLYSVNNHVFYVEYFEGLQEIVLLPSTSQTLYLNNKNMLDSYYDHKMDSLCNPNEKINIVLYDNYMRKYTIKTGFDIGTFKN